MINFSYWVKKEEKEAEFYFNENRFRRCLNRARHDKQWIEWAIKRNSDNVTIAQSRDYHE